MPECHTCEHYLAPQWKNVPFEQTPCAGCRLTDEQNHKGRSHVSRDASDGVDAEISMQVPHDRAMLSVLREAFLTWMREFMGLPAITRDLVAYRMLYPDRSLRIMAEKKGISVQAAHSRIKRALEKVPSLKAVISITEYNRRLLDAHDSGE